MRGRFRAVEPNLEVGAVAEWLVGGVATAAETIFLLHLEGSSLKPFPRSAFRIALDRLKGERNGTFDQVGSVSGDSDLQQARLVFCCRRFIGLLHTLTLSGLGRCAMGARVRNGSATRLRD